MTRKLARAFALLLGGCTTGALPTQVAGTPETGMYSLSVVGPATGNCSPPTVSGPLTLPQMLVDTSRPRVLGLWMPDTTVDLNSYHASFQRIDVVDGNWDKTVDTCGATHELRIVLGETSTNELSATRTDAWRNTAAATRTSFGCDYVPANDCTTSAELLYALSEPCPPPCTFAPKANGTQSATFVCSCIDGGVP